MGEKNNEFEKAIFSLREVITKYKSGLYEKKKELTPDFNAFSIMYALELPLSRIFGDLLNPKGTHSQGKYFLDLFINKFLSDWLFLRKAENIDIELEHPISNEGRIDILINFNQEYGVAIENKPFAKDLDSQITYYCEYMSRSFGDDKFVMLYFSGKGLNPSERSISKQEIERLGKQFSVISYKKIEEWCNECAAYAKKVNAYRLSILIQELAEYISREFLGENTLKNEILGETIEKHILEAFEIATLWQDNKNDFEDHWRKKINYLFNEKLPLLVFESLKKDGTLDDNWEWIKGNFDVNTLHLEGFGFKKKKWKHFKIVVISDRFKTERGKREIFPAIISKEKIHRENYIEDYCKQTGVKYILDPFLKKPPTQWYAEFPAPDYHIWGYDQWAGIKEEGPTVKYIANFLKKLIKAAEKDIDIEEKTLEKD